MEFKDFKKSKIEKTIEKINEDEKSAIKNFLVEKTIISDKSIVAMIMLKNDNDINEENKNELELFKYIKENKITEKGNEFLSSKETINKLRQLLDS